MKRQFQLTSLFLFAALFSWNIAFAQLSGTKTIGGTSPDYSSIGAAISALNSSGVNGAVVFNIRQGTYTERLTITQVSGVSSTNTITFQSDPSNTQMPLVQFTSTSSSEYNNNVVRFNGADYVTLKGIHFKALGTNYGGVIYFTGSTISNTVTDCKVEGITGFSTSSNYHKVIYGATGTGSMQSYTKITNNEVLNGYYPIYLWGGSTSTTETSNEITGNTVTNFTGTGITAVYQDRFTIQNNNVVSSLTNQYSSGVGIQVNSSRNGGDISGNKVVTYGATSQVLYLHTVSGTSSLPLKVHNNFLSALGTGANYGLWAIRCSNGLFNYNSIYSTGNSGASGVYLYSGSTSYTSNQLRNNNVHMKNGYALRYDNSTYYNIYTNYVNYNNWYTEGTYPIRYHSAQYSTVAAWSSVYSLDGNSLSNDPGFFSPTDLHCGSVSLDGKGQAVSGFTKDIDGDTRNTSTPDLGADEYNVVAIDAGISTINQEHCAGVDTVEVTLRNNGTSTLSSASIGWAVSKNSGSYQNQTAYSWTGSLTSGTTAIVKIGTYNFPADTNISIRAFTYSPNSSVDSVSANDTVTTSNFKTKMSGTYTIGGSSPNYSTITAAFNDLKNTGVCGPVTFHIRSGTYSEQMNLTAIPGVSSVNTVKFTKDPSSSTQPTLTYSSYPVFFNGANYVTIEDLNIVSSGSGSRVYFNSTTTGVSIKNNTITAYNVNSTSTGYSAVYSPGYAHNNMSITGNDIQYGSYGIYFNGNSGIVSNSIVISDNKISDFYYTGIYLTYFDGMTMNGNEIEDKGSYGTVFSTRIRYCDLIKEVANNKIINHSVTNAYGLSFYQCFNSNTNRGLIYNNMISMLSSNSGTRFGIIHEYSNYLTTAFNSVFVKSNYTSTYGIYIIYGDQSSVYNNNVSMTRGYALYTNSTTNIDFSNYNNWYTGGSYLAYWGGNRSTISQLSSYSGKDGNSKKIPVVFESETDLHTSTIGVDKAGTPISGISTDFDGQTRSTSSPDIGADEFKLVSDNAGITGINTLVCSGNATIEVTVKNYGTDTLKSVKLNWAVQKNGGSFVGQTAWTWNGVIAPGASAQAFFGSYNFGKDTTYALRVHTSLPNNKVDSVTDNDSLTSANFKPALSGTYTIGGSSPNYSTIAAAMTDLSNFGICGPTVFNIRSGTYTEQMNLVSITGTDDTTTITFQSDPSNSTKPVIRHSNNTVYFNGGNHYVIKGLQIEATGTSYRVYFARNTQNVTLDSNTIVGYNVNSTSSSYTTIFSNGYTHHDISFTNNTIQYGSYAMYWSVGSSSTNLLVENNTIENFYYQGMYTFYGIGMKVSNNTIEDKGSYSNVYSLYIRYADNLDEIANNVIINNSTGNSYGIFLDRVDNTSSAPGMIYNNMISLTRTSSVYQYGFYFSYGTYQTVAFNSVYSRSSYNYRSYGAYYYRGSNYRQLNNTFVMNRGMAYYTNYSSTLFQSDYNNLYTTGSYIAYYNGNRSTLSNLKSASGKEQNSINTNVTFKASDDLHLGGGSNTLRGKGTPISGITTDIDGETRNSSKPDIGADETTPIPNDAGISETKQIYCVGNQPFEVTLKNFGTSTLTSATVNIYVQKNGGLYVAQSPFSWTGSLAKDEDTTLSIGTNNFQTGSSYSIITFTTNPNGIADTANYNDTAYSQTSQPGLSGTYTVGGSSPDYTTPVAALTALKSANLCGPVTFLVRSGTYNGQMNMTAINGSSSTNTITFTNDPGNTSPAILKNSTQTLYYNGIGYITFKGLTIESTSGYAVFVNNIGEDVVLEDNTLKGYNINSTSTGYSVLFGNTSADFGNLTIKGNKFQYGSYSMYFNGNSSTRPSGLTIEDNEFEDYYSAAFFSYCDDVIVKGNTFEDEGSHSGAISTYFNYCNGSIDFSNNEIINHAQNGRGIYTYRCYGTTVKKSKFYNNSVVMTSTTTGQNQTFYNYQSTYQIVAFNSFNSLTRSNSSSGYYIYYGDQVELYNNNISMYNGYPIYTNSTANIDFSDYNNLYSKTGSYVAYWAAYRTTISNLSSATGKNSNSLDVDPGFYSDTDLHSNSSSLDSAGFPYANINDDFDGDVRNTSKPDIGFDEFQILEEDAGVDSVSTSVCAASSTVYIAIKNFGTKTLTSAKVHWAVQKNNGAFTNQTTYSWSGSLSPGSTALAAVGSYTYQTDTTYRIKAYTTLPNNVVDSANSNDTLVTDAYKTAMSGTYTVGSSGASYTTINGALSDLETYGMCGPVTINVKAGTYNEALIFKAYEGLGSTNKLTVQADPSNTADAVVTNAGVTMQITGANYLTIKGLRIEGTSSNSRMQFNTSATEIHVDGNTIVGFNTTSTSSYTTIHLGSGIKLTNCSVKNNTMTYGVYAIYGYGSSSIHGSGLTIENNSIKDFVYSAIYLRYQDQVSIKGNDIEDRGSNTYVYSVYLRDGNVKEITANKVVNNSRRYVYAIQLEYVSNSNFSRGIVANNMVSATGTSGYQQWGIAILYSTYQTVVYNSVFLNGVSGGNNGIRAYSGDQLSMFNNNISTNQGYPLYTNSNANIDFTNYNNFYTKSGSYVAYWNGNRTTITALSSYSGKDGNSISKDPKYDAIDDLHTSEISLDNAGTPISGINVDFDGQTRSTSTPDIGADEFRILANDAAMDSVSTQVCVGSTGVKATFLNKGTSSLTSVKVNWAVSVNNGAFVNQTQYSWTGSIANDVTTTATIGTYNFKADSLYRIRVWTTLPNAVADSNSFNDTATTASFKTSMSGTYTIGGSNPSYSTFAAAMSDLTTYGVCGPTTFNIRQGTYTEQLSLVAVEGADSTNRITFQSDPSNSSQAILNSNSFSVRFNSNANYFTVRDLDIRSSSSGYRVYASGNMEGNILEDNTILGYNISTTSTGYTAVYISGGVLKDFKIRNNDIRYGSYGLFVSMSTASSGTDIQKNKIYDFYYQGLYATNVYDVLIDSNYISDRGNYSNVYSMNLNNCDNMRGVTRNTMINNSTNQSFGIYLNGCSNTSGNEGLIANNMISLMRTSSVYQYGLYFYYCGYLNVAFNSIKSNSSYNTRSYGVYFYQGNNMQLHNNAIHMNRGYCLYTNNTSLITSSDNNLFYKLGSYMAYWGTNHTSLGNLQSYSGKNTNSVYGSFSFVSNTNLHMANSSTIGKGKGKPVSGVTEDIDGESRDTFTPDIGADESLPVPNDAGIPETKQIYCVGSNAFEVRLRNFGSNTLTSAKINIFVQANGGSYSAQPQYSWTGSLAPGTDTLLKIGTYNFLSTTTYSVVAFTTLPNNTADGQTYNDTASSATGTPGMSGTYTIGGVNPDFTSISAAVSALNSGGVCGPTTFNIRSSTYVGQLKLDPVNGNDSTNHITFQSDPSNTTQPILTYSGYTLYLNRMEHVTVRGLNIQGTGISSRVYIANVGTKNIIDSCTITGYNVNSSSSSYTTVYGLNMRTYGHLIMTNNVINYGSNGVYLSNSSTTPSDNFTFENNEVKNFYSVGLATVRHNNVMIRNNSFDDRSTASNPQGLFVSAGTIDEVSGNTVLMSHASTVYGIYINSCVNSANDRGIIANNMVSCTYTSSTYQYGIYMYYSQYQTVAYNSVNIRSSRSNSMGIYTYYGDQLYLYNNNVATRGGYPLYSNSTTIIDGSDNNNWYTTGNYVAYWGGSRSSISNLSSYTGKDQNSIKVNPSFFSTTNLHTNSSSLNGAGTPVSGITTDFDGDTRNTSTPDIGADEFSLYNIGVSELVSTDSLCPSTDTVKVKIKNYGSLTVTSATINWYMKTTSGSFVAQTPVSFSGSLANSGEATITLGTFNFLPNETYTLLAVTANPNSSVDGDKGNDTLNTTILSHALPGASLNNLSGVCVDSSAFTLSAGTPSGGTYSGVGVSAGKFNAATAGVGNHVITYSMTSIHGCSDSDTAILTVNALPTVGFSALSALCVDNAAVNLSGGSPSGGTYSGNGVSSGQFNANTAGTGNHVLTYLYTDANGCKESDTSVQVVNALPSVSLTLSEKCSNASSFNLSGGTPTGGTYSGNGVSSGSFNPTSSGAGSHPIVYTYTDGNSCTNADTTNLVVNAAPSVSIGSVSPICSNASSITLNSGSPSGGTYSGTGVSTASFNPTTAGSGTHKVVYSYTDSKSCTDTASTNVEVHLAPNVTLSNLSNICSNASSITLSGGSPSGGSYAGTGVSGGQFNPVTAGSGSHLITYSLTDNNSCTDSASTSILVNSAPTVGLTLNDVCSDSGSFTLAGGTPAGGTYSGNGVSAGSFNTITAGVGSHLITYTYTDGNSCTDSDTASQIVKSTPSVSFAALSSVCDSNATFSLSGGTPGSGTYSGTGVSAGSFSTASAGPGNHLITYSYTSSNGCSAEDTSTQIVLSLPTVGFSTLTTVCEYDTAFTLSSATPSGGVYTGTGISAGKFDPGTAGAGTHSIKYTYTASNGCKNDTTQNQVVSATPVVSFTSVANQCDNSPSVSISGTPSGGVFTGSGVSGSNFNPATAGSGSHQLIYKFTNSDGCHESDTVSAKVSAAPTASHTNYTDVCIDTGLIVLGSGLPSGGTYKGSGVASGNFNPMTAGSGTHVLNYVYSDTNSCMDSATANITVNALPIVSLTIPAQLCLNTNLTLTSGLPAGGMYSGSKVLGSTFTPTITGTDTINYEYTDTNSCTNDTSVTINIVAPPTVSFAQINDICLGSIDSLTLNQGLPTGGTYKGNNANSSSGKYGAGNIGTDTLWYIVTQGVCTDSSVQTVTVHALPVVGLTAPNVCDNQDTFALTGGTPSGGTYYGNSVTNNVYFPFPGSSGKDTLTYVFADGNNCTDTATTVIDLFIAPTTTFTLQDSICTAEDSIALNTGTPSGGFYSGSGVNGTFFNPANALTGTNVVTYVYVDANNCSDSTSENIVVSQTPTFNLGNDTTICGLHYLTLKSGYGAGFIHTWSLGGSDTSLDIYNGGSYWLTVSNANAPACFYSDTIEVSYEGVCVSIDEQLADFADVSYYPNPSDGMLNARLIGFENLEVQMTVVSMQGKIVLQDTWSALNAESEQLIDLRSEANGIYFIHLNTSKGNVVHRITISK